MTFDEVRDTVHAEFSDIGDGAGIVRIVVRLCVAVMLGGVLGGSANPSARRPACARTCSCRSVPPCSC